MVNIPDSFQVGGGDAAFVESDRLRALRIREQRQGFGQGQGVTASQLGATVAGTAAGGTVVGLFSGLLMGAARRRSREAIERRQREEQAAANERRRVAAYEARYGRFDLLTASMNAERQSAPNLLMALRRPS